MKKKLMRTDGRKGECRWITTNFHDLTHTSWIRQAAQAVLMGRRETSASVWQKNAEKNDITFQYVYTHLLWAFVTAVHQRHYRARFTSFPLDNPSSFFLFHGEIKSISPRVCLSILQCHPLYPDCLVLPSHCRCWFQSWSSSLSVFEEKFFFFLFIFTQIPSISTGRRHRVFWEWTSRVHFHD